MYLCSNLPHPLNTHTHTHTHTHIPNSDYIKQLESYISQESDFHLFVTTMRAEYDFWLMHAGQEKFKAISVQGTLAGTLEEVCICELESPEMLDSN